MSCLERQGRSFNPRPAEISRKPRPHQRHADFMADFS